MIRDVGEMALDSANDMNVPVVCMLHEPDRDNGLWSWTAINFMPRRERCGSGYRLEADTKEEIVEAVRKHVLPLYQIATENIGAHGENYYWERKSV